MLNVLESSSDQVNDENGGLQQEKEHVNELWLMRNRLKDLNAWPAAGDDILELVPEFNRNSPPLTESDKEWLPQVVRDALNGVDIGFQYPSFFQKLLMNPRLRRRFLAELEITFKQQ